MIEGLKNFLNGVNSTNQTVATAPVTKTQTYSNPFANPFLSQDLAQMNKKNEQYGKNNPVPGGYFAGYYNNKPNIVGRRLFVEV